MPQRSPPLFWMTFLRHRWVVVQEQMNLTWHLTGYRVRIDPIFLFPNVISSTIPCCNCAIETSVAASNKNGIDPEGPELVTKFRQPDLNKFWKTNSGYRHRTILKSWIIILVYPWFWIAHTMTLTTDWELESLKAWENKRLPVGYLIYWLMCDHNHSRQRCNSSSDLRRVHSFSLPWLTVFRIFTFCPVRHGVPTAGKLYLAGTGTAQVVLRIR